MHESCMRYITGTKLKVPLASKVKYLPKVPIPYPTTAGRSAPSVPDSFSFGPSDDDDIRTKIE